MVCARRRIPSPTSRVASWTSGTSPATSQVPRCYESTAASQRLIFMIHRLIFQPTANFTDRFCFIWLKAGKNAALEAALIQLAEKSRLCGAALETCTKNSIGILPSISLPVFSQFGWFRVRQIDSNIIVFGIIRTKRIIKDSPKSTRVFASISDSERVRIHIRTWSAKKFTSFLFL